MCSSVVTWQAMRAASGGLSAIQMSQDLGESMLAENRDPELLIALSESPLERVLRRARRSR
jgi:hypothetical protein